MNPDHRRPLIFDIHRFALDDGPGIRTTVFFKGCPLACLWCHNPEGMHSGPELYYQARKCIGCGDCAAACGEKAVHLNGMVRFDRQRCNGCGRCVEVCPARAVTLKGRYHDPEELVARLLIDKRFFHHSRGGVTFSGGEPTRHPGYLGPVVRRLKAQGVHVALQTCGHFQWEPFAAELLPWIDLIYFDLKIFDPRDHAKLTGCANHTILANFSRLAGSARKKMICTIPLVDGLTTPVENLRAIAGLVGALDDLPYRLYPYHPGGLVKTEALGKPAPPQLSPHVMSDAACRGIAATFERIVNDLRQGR